ncbi:MAG: RIP metalloprotease RseP [Verrucomicrobiota bacterium]
MAIIKDILIILEVLLLFNLLIGVHELGHFLAAKWRGLKIDRFAIWFGKPIWKKRIGGVEYALGWIPAGGYVALPQMASMEAIEGKSESSEKPLPNISAVDKIIVAFAGPLFSFLLAIAFAVLVWMVGKPMNSAGDSTVIGWVDPSGPAAKSGLKPGDKILEVDGHPVLHFAPPSQDSVKWRLITSAGTNIAIKYERAGEVRMAYPTPYHRQTKKLSVFGLFDIPLERRALRQILIDAAYPAVVDQVLSNSPAALAGLQPGDEIIAVNGEKIYSFVTITQLEQTLTNAPIPPVAMTIRRGNEEFVRELVAEKPLKPEKVGPLYGIAWQMDTNTALTHPSPLDQVRDSAGQIFATVGALFGKNEIGLQQLGGAVMIVRVYSNLFDSEQGWRLVLWFSVVMNVNLAMLNLLPLPVLDGGHILLAFLEIIRRRPVSARILQYIQTTFAVLLISFMVVIAFFDAGDWIRGSRAAAQEDQPIIFAPKK